MSAVRALPLPGTAPGTVEPESARIGPRLRLLPGVRTVPLTPFLSLIAMLLIVGLGALLVVNTALARRSFDLAELRRDVAFLEVQRTELAAELARQESPAELAERASRLGMRPGGAPKPLTPATPVAQ